MHVGQHEAADYASVISKTTPTSKHEYNFTILGRNRISTPTTSHLYINTNNYLLYTFPCSIFTVLAFSSYNYPFIILRGLPCFFLQRKSPIIFITRYALSGFRYEKSSFSLNEKSISHRNLVMKMIGNNKAEKTVNPRNHNEGREKILILKKQIWTEQQLIQ